MDRIRIRGGRPLEGRIPISGAKNAALPLMAAGLLIGRAAGLLERAGPGRHRHHGRAAARSTAWRSSTTRRRAAITLSRRRSPISRRPTTWCARCAPRSWCSARCWPASARPRSRCPAAAPSARARSTSTSRGWSSWAPRSSSSDGYIHAKAPRGLKGAAHPLPAGLGRRHREPADGRRARRRARPCWSMPRASRRSADLADCLMRMGARIEGIGTDKLRDRGQ